MIFSRSSWICLFWLDKVPRLLSQMVAGFNFSSDGIESVKKTNRNKSLRFPKVSYRSLRFPVVSQGSLSVKPKLEHGHIVRCIQLMYHTLVHHMCKNFTNDWMCCQPQCFQHDARTLVWQANHVCPLQPVWSLKFASCWVLGPNWSKPHLAPQPANILLLLQCRPAKRWVPRAPSIHEKPLAAKGWSLVNC